MAVRSIQFPNIRDTQLNGILPYVKKAVQFLNETNDYTTQEVGTALAFLRDAFSKDQHVIPQEGTKHGLGECFQKIWISLSGHYTPSDTSQAGHNLNFMTDLFWNYCNDCPAVGCDLGKYGALDCIINTLKKFEKYPDSKWKSSELNKLLGILHNSVKHDECAANRSTCRTAGASEPLKKLIDSSQMLIKLKSLLVFSYIANESDSNILGRDKQAVVFLVDLLKIAVASSAHCAGVAGVSFDPLELLKGLNNLVVNDANKQVVLKNRGIPVIITRMLQSDFTEKEQHTAVMTLWNLSFDEKVRQSNDMKKACQGIFFSKWPI